MYIHIYIYIYIYICTWIGRTMVDITGDQIHDTIYFTKYILPYIQHGSLAEWQTLQQTKYTRQSISQNTQLGIDIIMLAIIGSQIHIARHFTPHIQLGIEILEFSTEDYLNPCASQAGRFISSSLGLILSYLPDDEIHPIFGLQQQIQARGMEIIRRDGEGEV